LYVLDEPTAGLDPILRGRVWEELHRLKDAGRTLLVTTQYVNESEECDNVALIAHGRLVALATPDELRREAMGGDIIEIETTDPFDGTVLSKMPEVRDVRVQGPRTFQVVVDEAGAATPAVMEAINEAGGDVAASKEFRPSFDDVFAELVERDEQSRDADPDEKKGRE
jgi:ABC-2 type transport system ATP-binding protein